MMRENSSPINGENQRFWKHLRKILLPGRNSRCTFSLTPPSPLHVKKRSKWHHLQKIFSARGSSSSFSPFTLKCPNSSFLETNFENFLLMHSAQHSLQRVLSSYRQFSFPLPLHIYMAKLSDFGNTWANFLPRRNSRCTFSQTPLTLHGKNRVNWHRLREIFSARDSSSNVQNRAFWKPLSKNFFKLLRTSINSHRSPMRIMPASSPVSGSILPASLLCENRSKWHHLQ